MTIPSADLARSAAGKTGGRRLPVADGVALAATALFLVAVLALALPALQSGRSIGPTLLLLTGVAGFSFLGVVAFSAANRVSSQMGHEDLDAFVSALQEASAVASLDGRLEAINLAWADLFGGADRLPRSGGDGQVVYGALKQAAAHGAGEGRLGGGEFSLKQKPARLTG